MQLYYSPNSPYARKVRVLILERDLSSRVELIEVSTNDPTGPLISINPLGKVPVMVTLEDGVIHDSPVICEYLDGFTTSMAGAGRAIDLSDKCLAATAHGILDAGYAARMEKQRPKEVQWQQWNDKQFQKIDRTLDHIEATVEKLPTEATIGAIGLACTIEWLQFRHAEGNWLAMRPKLNNWVSSFGKRSSMSQTRPA